MYLQERMPCVQACRPACMELQELDCVHFSSLQKPSVLRPRLGETPTAPTTQVGFTCSTRVARFFESKVGWPTWRHDHLQS